MIEQRERIVRTTNVVWSGAKPRLRRWYGMWMCSVLHDSHTLVGLGHSFEGAYNEWLHLTIRSLRG